MSAPVPPPPAPAREAVLALVAALEGTPLVDGHNDLAWQYRERVQGRLGAIPFADTRGLDPPMHTDLARLRAGGVGAQFWSAYVPVERSGSGVARLLAGEIDFIHRLVETHPDDLELAATADDVVRIRREGRIASLIGVEGGHAIESSLAVLRAAWRSGARYLTLTHWKTTDWADAATDVPRHGGLALFGREVVRELNRLGMLVDLSHVAPKTMHDALDESAAPVVFSHSSARALCDHPRNVSDEILRRLAENGGVAMVTFVPSFLTEPARAWKARREGEKARLESLHPHDPDRVRREHQDWAEANPAPRVTLADVADHVEHVRRVSGAEHVGIGSDFDGTESVPEGLEDVSRFPDLLAELQRRGWDAADLRRLAGENVLRVMRAAEAVAEKLRRERPASEAEFLPAPPPRTTGDAPAPPTPTARR